MGVKNRTKADLSIGTSTGLYLIKTVNERGESHIQKAIVR
jgi:hypothetical protein